MTTAVQRKSTWIPWIFVIGMLVVFAVNGVLVYLALSTWTGIETKNYYQKGIAYNDNLAGAERQAQLGWTVAATLTPDATTAKAQTVRAVYRDRSGVPVTDLRIRAYLVRPVHEGYDQTLALAHTGNGVYEATTTVPLPGQWELRLVALGPAGETHQTTTRVSVAE